MYEKDIYFNNFIYYYTNNNIHGNRSNKCLGTRKHKLPNQSIRLKYSHW